MDLTDDDASLRCFFLEQAKILERSKDGLDGVRVRLFENGAVFLGADEGVDRQFGMLFYECFQD